MCSIFVGSNLFIMPPRYIKFCLFIYNYSAPFPVGYWSIQSDYSVLTPLLKFNIPHSLLYIYQQIEYA